MILKLAMIFSQLQLNIKSTGLSAGSSLIISLFQISKILTETTEQTRNQFSTKFDSKLLAIKLCALIQYDLYEN